MSKPPAKAAAVSKTTGKTTGKSAKVAAKPAAKSAPVKPAAKPVPSPSKSSPSKSSPSKSKPAAKPAAKTPAPVKPVAKAAPKAAAKPAAPVAKAAKTVKPVASKTPVTPPAPQPAPAPSANRFTDRFAPAAKPAARQMTETVELPKIAQKIDPKVANAWKTKTGRELSDAELLAMPESEYMKERQVDFFRARLQQQRDELLSSAGETTEHLREDTSIVPDPVDRATIEEEHALELRTRDRERKLLKKIAQSLGRLETGEYGFCDETGEPIGLARLVARPTASLSLEAQQRREMKQKMFGN